MNNDQRCLMADESVEKRYMFLLWNFLTFALKIKILLGCNKIYILFIFESDVNCLLFDTIFVFYVYD